MALLLTCVNKGGPLSLIRLDHVPQFHAEASLSPQTQVALSLWQARPGEILAVIDREATACSARITGLDPGHAF